MIQIDADNIYTLCSLNPVLFTKMAFNIDADKWQEDIMYSNPSRTLLLCSRQSGKSTVSASLALHKATFFYSSLILIVSNTYRQAEETFRKIKVGLPFVTSSLKVGVIYETQTMLEMSNGSRIVALPGKQDSIRSFSSVCLLIIDEAAQVSDEVYKTVRPMLAVSNGDIIALTTPFGKRGWFYKTWSDSNNWYKVKITADDCPRISKEFIDEEIRETGLWWVKQEYFCEFVDTEEQLFTHDDIINIIDPNLFKFEIGNHDLSLLRYNNLGD